MLYPVAIQQKENVFHAYLPDIPELEINDTSMADTISTARQAVIDHLNHLVNEERAIPKASEINNLVTNPKYAGWTWAIVSIDINRIIGNQIELKLHIQRYLYEKIQQKVGGQSAEINGFIINAIKKALL